MKHKIKICIALMLAAVPCPSQEGAFDYSGYASVLEAYVDRDGLVNYRGLKADRKRLDTFLEGVSGLDPLIYDAWPRGEKIAFWINVYNALTLKAVITKYPIKPRFFASIRFPDNSIRQIAGVWDKWKHPVMGRYMTLDEIEHGILRSKFDEPRIHMALNCASMGCPPLAREPFRGERLDDQFAERTRLFLKDASKFRIHPSRKRIEVSPIFQWFGDDFLKAYGGGERGRAGDKTECAVLTFIAFHLDREAGKTLACGDYEMRFLPYDWSLNEQKKPDGRRE
jgi:hypothetical protein